MSVLLYNTEQYKLLSCSIKTFGLHTVSDHLHFKHRVHLDFRVNCCSLCFSVKPKVVVRLLRSEVDLKPAMLMCSVYDYHPKGIKVSWLRDGEVISEGTSSTDELSNGDWHYQIHSYLEYKPRPGENISCVVEHESLTRPLIHTWGENLGSVLLLFINCLHELSV